MKTLKTALSMTVGLARLHAELALGKFHSGNCPRVRVRFLRGLSRLLKRNGI